MKHITLEFYYKNVHVSTKLLKENIMKKNLFLRTDVLPEEIPILFSNKAVYMNFTKQRMKLHKDSSKLLEFVTVPLFYHIPKSSDEKRKIGLLHPIAQIQTFDYMLRYEQLILSFCENSTYSVRSPMKRNRPKIKDIELRKKEIAKIAEEYSFNEKLSVTSEEDQILFYNFFSYRKYKKITELYNSPRFNRDKYKYNFFLKLDIQRCFPSIYTHSLAWAIFGDKSLAKKYRGVDNSFPNASDKISQKINFNETHGLVVGPEFSRVIAELLFTRIDIDLEIFAKKNDLQNKREYSLYRFIDDYFIFAAKKEHIELLQSFLRSELEKYNLTLNIGKTELQEKPFEIYDASIIGLKRVIKEFEFDKLLSAAKKHIEVKDYKGEKNQWNDLFFKIENLIAMYPNSKSRTINYFLKTIRGAIFYDGEYKHRHVISNILEIVTNIFTLDINYKSTNYLIAIFAKLLGQIKDLYREYEISRKELSSTKSNNEEIGKKINEIDKKLESLKYLQEKMFQHLFMVLKNNIGKIEDMYDIFILMKLLNKKLSSSFLCRVLSEKKDSYFVCCSIAYYILEEDLSGLDTRYITVINKIKSVIDEKIYDYLEKGAKYPILEGEYFYFLNDFSKYPGFRNSLRKKYDKFLKKEYKRTILDGNGNIMSGELDIWESITKCSYYDWNATTETFVRKIAKKSSNMARIDSSSDY
ncbi:RNA-directed DNA polymerase [Enterococcus durans]|nr:RNA-directed DNA polymerase [Enterococcus durans]